MDSNYIRKLVGLHLGYPLCCIDEFIFKSVEDYWFEYKKQYLDGYGFIPCDKCIEKIKNGEVTLEDLITNRTAPEAYPNYTQEHQEEFLRTVLKCEKDLVILQS